MLFSQDGVLRVGDHTPSFRAQFGNAIAFLRSISYTSLFACLYLLVYCTHWGAPLCILKTVDCECQFHSIAILLSQTRARCVLRTQPRSPTLIHIDGHLLAATECRILYAAIPNFGNYCLSSAFVSERHSFIDPTSVAWFPCSY